LLRQLFPDYRYFTLDDLDHLEWAKRDPKGFIQAAGNKAIIDEIQRFPALTIAVKYAIDNEDAILMMTASSTVGLLDASADTLAGRINLIELPTACWGEDDGKPRHSLFSGASPSPPQIKSGTRKMREALTFGQFPEILTTDGAEDKESLLKNYRDTYFSRDLMQLANLENLEGLIAIFANLIRSLGSHLEVSSFAREAGLSYPTAKKYLNTLNQSRLTFKLYGYQYGPAKRHIKAAKTYFADNGIINSFNVQIGEGQLFENFVIAELEKRRKLGLIQADRFYYYKSTSGREIDLVFEEKDTVYAVEIKASRNPDRRDFRNLIEFGKSIEKKTKLFLIYQGEDHTTVDGVRLLPVALLYRGA
jgi:predicted AAA+ superfamily ATPase